MSQSVLQLKESPAMAMRMWAFNLTVSILKIPGTLDFVDSPNGDLMPVGQLGDYMRSIWNYASGYQRVKYVLPESGQVGKDVGNGTFNGVIGLLQRGEADVNAAPYVIDYSDTVVDYSPVVNSFLGRIMQKVEPDTQLYQLLFIFKTVDISFWLYIFVTLTLVALIISILQGRRHSSIIASTVNNFYDIVRVMFNEYNGIALTSCLVLELFYCLGSYSFLICFLNAMNSDMVVKNESHIIDSLDDLLRLDHVRPGMFVEGIFAKDFRLGVNKQYQAIWDRMKRMGFELSLYKLDPQDFGRSQSVKTPLVFIGADNMCIINAKMAFGYNEERMFWISPESFAEKPMSFYMSKHFNKTYSTVLKHKINLVTQSGCALKMWKTFSNSFPPGSKCDYFNCIKDSKENFYDKVPTKESIGLVNVRFTLIACCLCLVLATLVIIIETAWKTLVGSSQEEIPDQPSTVEADAESVSDLLLAEIQGVLI